MNITDESITADDTVYGNLLGKSIYKISQYFKQCIDENQLKLKLREPTLNQRHKYRTWE
jgi:hypothetical protein